MARGLHNMKSIRTKGRSSIYFQEQTALVEKADHAHKLQIKAQKTAEDALNHLELFIAEQEKLVKKID